MKIFISFLVILFLFLYLFYERKKKTENFEDDVGTESSESGNKFRDNFSNDYFYPKYYILMRDITNSWKDMVVPQSIFYQSKLKDLSAVYDPIINNFIKNIVPNFTFKINIKIFSKEILFFRKK